MLLLDEQGGSLPTNVQPARPGAATAAKVVLAPREAARAGGAFLARHPRRERADRRAPCEPRAFTVRVTIGGGTLDAPVPPEMPVCERGMLNFDVFTAARWGRAP